MKTPAALATAALLACACATPNAVEKAVIADDPAPTAVEQHCPSIHDMGTEFDPGASVGVTRSEPLLEPMPFGGSTTGSGSGGAGRHRTLRTDTGSPPVWGYEPPDSRVSNRIGDSRRIHVQVPENAERYRMLFVRKDLHTVMHYIALRTRLQLIVEGTIDCIVTMEVSSDWDMDDEEQTKRLLKDFASQADLEYIEDGLVIILRRKRPPVGSSHEHGFNVSLDGFPLDAAVTVAAHVMDVRASLSPAAFEATSQELIWLRLDRAGKEKVLQRLADLCDLKLVKVSDDEEVPEYELRLKTE